MTSRRARDTIWGSIKVIFKIKRSYLKVEMFRGVIVFYLHQAKQEYEACLVIHRCVFTARNVGESCPVAVGVFPNGRQT